MIPERTTFKTIEITSSKDVIEKLAKPKEWTSKTVNEFLAWMSNE